jgi:intein/homing endonuclease
MRIKLKKGKQTQLTLAAKRNLTWKELASQLNISEQYLSKEIRTEKRLISEEIFMKLCNIANLDYVEYIEEKLSNNWGRSKGGKISSLTSKGSTIQIKTPEKNEKLAELIGIILGDGNISYRKDKKTGVYQINVTGHKELDKDYHLNYISKLFKELFDIKTIEVLVKKSQGRHLIVSSKKLVEFIIELGLKSGDKIKNQVSIPNWIKENNEFLKACIRGLIDTDGCIHRMSNQDPNLLRISFTNYNLTLLKDVREAFIKLGFSPSKIIRERDICVSKKIEISKYLKEIGFSNKKHQDRLIKFIAP